MDKTDDPRRRFDAGPAVEELIEHRGKGPLAHPVVLLASFWPEGEPVEKFLAALCEWRGRSGPAASYEPGAILDRWVLEANCGDVRREWLRMDLARFETVTYHRRLCAAWADVTVGD